MAGMKFYADWRPFLYAQVFNTIVNCAENNGKILDTRMQNRIKKQAARLLENRIKPYLEKLVADCIAENTEISNLSPVFDLEARLSVSSVMVIVSSDEWDKMPAWSLGKLSDALFVYLHERTMWTEGSADWIMFIEKTAREVCAEINDGKIA